MTDQPSPLPNDLPPDRPANASALSLERQASPPSTKPASAVAVPAVRGNETLSVAASLMQIPVTLQVVLGTARLPLSRIAELKPGSTVNLDQTLGTPAMVLINGRAMARCSLFVLDGDDARLGITITEIISAGAAAASP